MLGEVSDPQAPNASEIADAAVELSPRDPLTAWLKASAAYDPTREGAAAEYTALVERVVRLSPGDTRWWVELGRAREQSADLIGAEAAYLRAIELAPNHSYPRWQFGNFLLRQERMDDALAELRKSASVSSLYREQVYSVVWDFAGGDTAVLDKLAGDDPEMLSGLAWFYLKKLRPDDVRNTWNRLDRSSKERYRSLSRKIAETLFSRRFFRTAVWIVNDMQLEGDIALGKVRNGGFETKFGENPIPFFGWSNVKTDRIELREDASTKHSGAKSFRVGLRGFSGPQMAVLGQVLAVEPGKRYLLRFWVKTEDLKSAALPLIEVIGFETGPALASVELPSGSADWKELVFEFSAPLDSDGIQIRLNRTGCGADCPVTGTLWLDDFSLEEAGR